MAARKRNWGPNDRDRKARACWHDGRYRHDMPISDERLLDFDTDRLAGFDRGRAERALEDQGDLYRNHLVIAHWLDGWVEAMADYGEGQEQFERALREVAAHLRQCDFLPGGDLYITAAQELQEDQLQEDP